MRNLWLVAKQEYRRTVLRRSFLAATLAVPLAIAAVLALVILVTRSGQSQAPIGYVDQAGIVQPPMGAPGGGEAEGLAVLPFPDQEAGLRALERREIQALFVLPPDYPAALRTELYTLERPLDQEAWRQFDGYLRRSLVAGYPEQVQQRLLEGPEVTVQDLTSGRQFSEAAVINIILPIVAAFLFFFAAMMASGYMVQVVADEKESRTMEVLLTTLTPEQLLGGKALGLLAAALSQLAVYVAVAVAGLLVAARWVPEIAQVSVPWGYLGLVALFFFPAYALIAALNIAIGAAVTEVQQGQQMAGPLTLLFLLPLILIWLIFENPAHPLVVALTLFPTSSFLTISLRWALGSLPAWQIAVSWLLLVGAAAATLWAAVRIFRIGMLRYGQPLSLRGMAAALRRSTNP